MQEPLVQKSGQEARGSIVQADDAVDVPACPAVVPGAHIPFFQKASGEVFGNKNRAGIDSAAHPEAFFAQQAGDGGKKSCHSIDGKHPYGRVSLQLHLPPLKRFQAGPENLQAPANQSAEDKLVLHHNGSMCRKRTDYSMRYNFRDCFAVKCRAVFCLTVPGTLLYNRLRI